MAMGLLLSSGTVQGVGTGAHRWGRECAGGTLCTGLSICTWALHEGPAVSSRQQGARRRSWDGASQVHTAGLAQEADFGGDGSSPLLTMIEGLLQVELLVSKK